MREATSWSRVQIPPGPLKISMNLQDFAKKEIEKIEDVIKEIKMVDGKGKELMELIESYFKDSKYFYGKQQHLQAFEAAVICWAYIDAGLHLKVFEVPEKFAKLFTV